MSQLHGSSRNGTSFIYKGACLQKRADRSRRLQEVSRARQQEKNHPKGGIILIDYVTALHAASLRTKTGLCVAY